jgi:hypothetical protein
MAILAMRERRRFNQLRLLGIKIPIEYVRVFSFVRHPRKVQMELIKYRSAVEEDSEYEDDETVLNKYKSNFRLILLLNFADDPITYIQQYSQ